MVPEIQEQGQTCSVKLCLQGSTHRAPQPWVGFCVVCQQRSCAESQQHRNSTNRHCLWCLWCRSWIYDAVVPKVPMVAKVIQLLMMFEMLWCLRRLQYLWCNLNSICIADTSSQNNIKCTNNITIHITLKLQIWITTSTTTIRVLSRTTTRIHVYEQKRDK